MQPMRDSLDGWLSGSIEPKEGLEDNWPSKPGKEALHGVHRRRSSRRIRLPPPGQRLILHTFPRLLPAAWHTTSEKSAGRALRNLGKAFVTVQLSVSPTRSPRLMGRQLFRTLARRPVGHSSWEKAALLTLSLLGLLVVLRRAPGTFGCDGSAKVRQSLRPPARPSAPTPSITSTRRPGRLIGSCKTRKSEWQQQQQLIGVLAIKLLCLWSRMSVRRAYHESCACWLASESPSAG